VECHIAILYCFHLALHLSQYIPNQKHNYCLWFVVFVYRLRSESPHFPRTKYTTMLHVLFQMITASKVVKVKGFQVLWYSKWATKGNSQSRIWDLGNGNCKLGITGLFGVKIKRHLWFGLGSNLNLLSMWRLVRVEKKKERVLLRSAYTHGS